MLFKVIQTINRSERSLRNITKPVCEFVYRNEYYSQQIMKSGQCQLAGQSGIPFVIKTHVSEDQYSYYQHTYIEDMYDGSVHVSIPLHLLCSPFKSYIYAAKGVDQAFNHSSSPAIAEYLAQLNFGQLPLDVAAKVMNFSTDEIRSNFSNTTDKNFDVFIASITRPSTHLKNTIVDVRGLLAWLVLNNMSEKE